MVYAVAGEFLSSKSKTPPMAEVFISYKSERRNAAQHLAKMLKLHGYSVWFDYWLLSGENFDTQIMRELNTAKAIVVLWRQRSCNSDWVKDEADRAKKLGSLASAR